MDRKKSVLLAIVSFALFIYSSYSLAGEDVPGEETFLVNSVATYKNDQEARPLISERSKDECELERDIPLAIIKSAPKFKIKAALHEAEAIDEAKSKVVSLEIGNLVGGRGGNGMGGRWVVSEIGVMITLQRGDKTEIAHKYFACSAGLGANPFANLKACDRLNRCSEQIGKRAAKWLSSIADDSD